MKRKTKILFYSGHCETIGGDAKYLFDLINNLNHDKYEIELSTDKNYVFQERAKQYLSKEMPIKYLDTRPVLFKKGRLKSFPNIFKILRLGHLRYGIHNALIFYRLFKSNSKHIDIFHFNNGGYPGKKAGLIAIIIAYFCGIKRTVMSIHNVPVNRKWYKISDYFFDILVSRCCKKIIIASENLRKEMISRRRFPSSRIIAIPCGLDDVRVFSDEERINIKKELNLKKESYVLLITAHLDDERKGHAILFKSLIGVKSKYPDTVLLVIGDGRRKKELMELSNLYGLRDNIIFLGYRKDIDIINSIIDVAIIPSIDFEAIPYSIKEAMRAGKPVIVTDTGGCNEAVEDNVNGMIVPKNNAEMLSHAILRLLENQALRLKMGVEGRGVFLNKFLLSDKILAHENVYKQLIAERV